MNNIIINSNGAFFKGKQYRCTLGKSGVSTSKKEGDGFTPAGCFPIRLVLYRPDRFEKAPQTVFPTRPLSQSDGWSDDANSSEYNTLVRLPYGGSHEKLWRDDYIYDIIVILGYNDNPPVAGKGSAIFIHLAREEYSPTAGCIAFSMEDLLEILGTADITTHVCVQK
ncbi:L,D-transpeptidase family protein [Patescibacteria group bacterium]|nr:L,D-transpeptidase family protein [Patescibacteria group bacterium]MBU4057760.1 L,D-transpeptidase family protein [Patescibacteria group bacterium]MBU4115691.1 L,D-transpeptidase family protein [Patescibacteria group bacterium]